MTETHENDYPETDIVNGMNNIEANENVKAELEENLQEQTKDPNISALQRLGRSVEYTRLNRIQASNRLLANEHFVQSINIYYSCFAAIITVLSLIYPDKRYSVLSALLSVILAISIVYLNAQKYGSRAQQLQSNFVALQYLGYQINDAIDKGNIQERSRLEKAYIDLLETSENHNQHDHKHTLYQQDRIDESKAIRKGKDMPFKRLRGIEAFNFWFIEIGNIFIRAVFWTFPVGYTILVLLGIV